MGNPIRLTFRYVERDFARAMRAHYTSRLRLKLDLVVIILVAGYGAYLWRDEGSHWTGAILVGLSGVLALILLLAFLVMPRIVFRRNPKFRNEYDLAFSTEGIHYRTVHIDSQLEWTLYTHALIDPSSFILYYGAGAFTVVPKRVFADREQLAAFEQLLVQKVAKIKRQG